jgi:two-component system sensor histidine kinase QseC
MPSIRRTLELWLIPLALGAGLAGAAAVYFAARTALRSYQDMLMVSHVGVLAVMVDRVDGRFEFRPRPTLAQDLGSDFGEVYYQLWRADGSVLVRSDNLHGADLAQPPAGVEDLELFSLTLPDGRPTGAAWARWNPLRPTLQSAEPPGAQADRQKELITIVVATTYEFADRWSARIGLGLAAMCLVGGVVVWLIVRAVVNSGLHPLRRLAAEVSRIGPDGLDRRVGQRPLPEELLPFSETINALLARLQEGFERERRFSDNAAHELRTPVAELRTLTEVALRHSDRSPEQMKKDLSTAGQIAVEMDGMVNALLRFARLRASHAQVERTRVDIGTLAREAAGAANNPGNLRVSIQACPDASAMVEPAAAAMIVSNAIENAMEYTPAGGWIDIVVTRGDDKVILTIRNGPVSLSERDAARVFEPLWRGPSDVSPGRHLGLGLAIAAQSAASFGGTCTARVKDGAFEFRAEFPEHL